MPDPATAAAPPPNPRFEASLAAVLRQEGGYVDNPLDPGGATNFGITRKTLAAWRNISPWSDLPASEVKALGQAEAGAIYMAQYWNPCNADALPQGLDLALFDFAVNSGPDRAIRTLQGEFDGLTSDGKIGPLTLAAIEARVAHSGVAGLINALCNRRLTFVRSLAAAATFGAGWSRRIAEIRAEALAMASPPPSSPAPKGISPMNLTFLAGYKTYIVGAAMLVIGIAQVLGITLPDFTGQAAGDLLMQGLAVIFLRQGITNTVAKT